MISIKPGAKIEGLKPEILLGLLVFEGVLERHGYDTVITEGTGGVHMEGSLHFQGLALDLRSKHILAKEKSQIVLEAKIALEKNFDLILEDSGGLNEHIHLETNLK